MSLRKILAVILCMALTVGLAACGSKPAPQVPEGETNEQAQLFMNELADNILPSKNRLDVLTTMDMVVSTKDMSLNLEKLDTFFESYEKGEVCTITIVFQKSDFMAVRLYYNGTAGRYYRYTYSENDPISVTQASFTEIVLQRPEQMYEYRLIIKDGKTERATFSF